MNLEKCFFGTAEQKFNPLIFMKKWIPIKSNLTIEKIQLT